MTIDEGCTHLRTIKAALERDRIAVFDFEEEVNTDWIESSFAPGVFGRIGAMSAGGDAVAVDVLPQLPNVFALVSGTRKYMWGEASEDDLNHSDAPRLRELLFERGKLDELLRHCDRQHKAWVDAARAEEQHRRSLAGRLEALSARSALPVGLSAARLAAAALALCLVVGAAFVTQHRGLTNALDQERRGLAGAQREFAMLLDQELALRDAHAHCTSEAVDLTASLAATEVAQDFAHRDCDAKTRELEAAVSASQLDFDTSNRKLGEAKAELREARSKQSQCAAELSELSELSTAFKLDFDTSNRKLEEAKAELREARSKHSQCATELINELSKEKDWW